VQYLLLYTESLFVIGLILIASIKREKSSLDRYLVVYLVLECFGILYGTLGTSGLGLITSDLVEFAISQILIAAVMAKMILVDIGSQRKILWSPIVLTLVFLFFCFVPVSTAFLYDVDFPPTTRTWFNYLQFGDFTTIASIIVIINAFFWLYNLIQSENRAQEEMEQRYMVIFAFFLFYGGAFLILVFSKLLLEDTFAWFEFLKTYYRPIYLTSYVIVTLAIRWKSVRSLF
jgi:hypothetical protein